MILYIRTWGVILSRLRFLNTEVDNYTMNEALTAIDELVEKGTPSYAVTPNVDHIVRIENDNKLAEVYRDADLIFTDGKPLIWISSLFGNRIKEKISGSDMFPLICKMAAEKGYRVFLLGAAKGVADIAAENLKKKIENLQIVGTCAPEIGFEKNPEVLKEVLESIRKAEPHILIVSLGCPKQEFFIHEYCKELQVPFSIGLGASIDFESGKVKRAPKWMRDHGFEWLHRIFQDPKRLARRYLIDDIRIVPVIFKYAKATRKQIMLYKRSDV